MPADVIVVGIGVAPATDWLDGSGLELRDGVVCDPTLCAGVAGVYAAGRPRPLAERAVRRGDAGRALDQRRRAGGGGRPQPARHRGRRRRHAPTRRCRSSGATRRRHRIQFLGRGGDDDDVEVEVVVGAPADGRFLALYGRRGRLIGALGVNAPRLVMPYRPLLAAAATWDDALALAT